MDDVGEELVSEPVESERWGERRRGAVLTYGDDPRSRQREAIGRF
jgi:hypothetical protein